ncbi:hypothetical protein SAMN05216326_1362 [Nitrosomonas marina]|uniref:Hydrazine synthase alpha subunit middle domain-containing protein n=1 Tax=Nitrosomonas marina TaxID=917 RepID=A0A1I0FAP7_9PROT|nr:hypothetical protein [Nitrosomonas marina]SET55286.1 hypothetical protein SAMN05216326_1362 [Nitrosomonas marina]
MKKLMVAACLVWGVWHAAQSFASVPIVYSRCERATGTFDLTGTVTVNGVKQTVTRTLRGLDMYDVLPDVTNFFSGFAAPCDLMLRRPDGSEQIVYNCSSNSTKQNACAALDPQVSFDGKQIAFSVFRGTLVHNTANIHSQVLHPDATPENLGWQDLPSMHLQSSGAHLHIYDLETKTTDAMPFEKGVFDAGPTFIDHNRLAFTSTRDGNLSTMVFRTNTNRLGTRIWAIDTDWKNLELSSHHSLSQEQHPFTLMDGRVAYSSWQIFGGLPFRYANSGPGWFTTLDNLFHIYTQMPDGAGNFPLFGQHSGDHAVSYYGEDHMAAHFMTQMSDGRVCFSDYYRGNNNGAGVIICVKPEPKGMEGKSPYNVAVPADMYVPHDVVNVAPWAINDDAIAKPLDPPAVTVPGYDDPMLFTGKLSHPAALPQNGLMMTWFKGLCSSVIDDHIFKKMGKPTPPLINGSGSGTGMNLLTHLDKDIPGCDGGIYLATKIPSRHPSDLQLIVDSPDWHEIMGRAVVPYQAIYGIEKPAEIPRADRLVDRPELPAGTPFGLLGAASITDRETRPRGGVPVLESLHAFHLQGTDTIDYTDEELCGVRMIATYPNRGPNIHEQIANVTGERVAILGEVPVLHYAADGSRIKDPSGHPDTSFLLSFPANTPYIMQGIDCDGRTLNTDQSWQHLRPGEEKTCGGCHVHARPTRIQFVDSFAATPAYVIPQLGRGQVPLLTGKSGNIVTTRKVPGYGMQIEFTRDIKPIFDRHCVSCHGGGQPAAGLALDRTNGANHAQNTTWWCLVVDNQQTCTPPELRVTGMSGESLSRPFLSKYIKAFNSRGSLLYWKAANQRTDNRTDAQYPNDINFGVDHPTSITPEELGMLSRWIDLGTPGGAQELRDTQKPTLNLAATIDDDRIIGLRIGTTDVGSGIDPDSLVVCIQDGQKRCQNIPRKADVHEIITMTLRNPISNIGAEIEASVKDLAGNETHVKWTVGWLLAHNKEQVH